MPALSNAPEIKFPEVQRAKLKNGLNVILLERHSAPIVNVALAVDAGYASDSPQKAGLASLALGLLDEGTKTRDAFEIVNQLDSLGARLRHWKFARYVVRALAGDFGKFETVARNYVGCRFESGVSERTFYDSKTKPHRADRTGKSDRQTRSLCEFCPRFFTAQITLTARRIRERKRQFKRFRAKI